MKTAMFSIVVSVAVVLMATGYSEAARVCPMLYLSHVYAWMKTHAGFIMYIV